MAQTDWGTLSGGLSTPDVLSGPTAGFGTPNGTSGNYVYGMRSTSDVPGAFGLYALQTNFSPTPTARGGRISGVMKRGAGAGVGFAPFLFFCATPAAVTGVGYMLGLSDEAASHIQLRKGILANGLASVAVPAPAVAPNVLLRSTDFFAADTWQHLRMDVIVQGTGDVIIQVLRNDLALHPASAPIWAAVPGMEGAFSPAFSGFVDDALGLNTGSVPLTSGYCGFGARFEVSGRAAFFDQIAIDRQL